MSLAAKTTDPPPAAFTRAAIDLALEARPPPSCDIKAFGEIGYGPGQLRGLHAIAMDASGGLFVADRGFCRIFHPGHGRQSTCHRPWQRGGAVAHR